jgi:hypothetical protein
MTKSRIRLSKWDKTWLSEINEEKWSYVLEYIRAKWPVEFSRDIPPLWSGNKQDFIRDLFDRLLQANQLDARSIVRKTKEAWRSNKQSTLRKSSGNYTHVKLTASDRNKMRKLADEVGLSSVSDVVSAILNDEYKELLVCKKSAKEAKSIETKNKMVQRKKNSIIDVISNSKLNKMKEINEKLEEELKVAHQNLALVSELFSEQQVLLERYADKSIEALTEDEIKQARELANEMSKSLNKSRLSKSLAK